MEFHFIYKASMKTKPFTEYALLGALMSGPKHGYEILQFLGVALGSTWHVGTSQLYVLLKRLEGDGLLTSSVELQDSLPSKRIFSLTPAGRDAFEEWLHSPTEHVRDLRIEFLAKLFFFNRLSLEGGSELIRAQVQALEKVREGMDQRQKREKDPFKKLTIGFRMATIEAWLQWLDNEATPFIGKVHKHE